MATIDMKAAAKVYIETHRTARRVEQRNARADAGRRVVVQAQSALTTAEEMWHALTGLTGQDAMDFAECVLLGEIEVDTSVHHPLKGADSDG